MKITKPRTRPTLLRSLFIIVVIVLSACWVIPAHAAVNTRTVGTRHLERDEVTGHVGSTREELLSRREQRKSQFGDKLDALKAQMEMHESGTVVLTEYEVQKIQKKIKAYENKLEYLNQEVDDRVSNFCARRRR